MNKNVHVRIRLSPAAARHLQGLRPRPRAQLVSWLVDAAYRQVDLTTVASVLPDLRLAAIDIALAVRRTSSAGCQFSPGEVAAFREFIRITSRLQGGKV